MKWVGILKLSNNKFHLNGVCIATTRHQLINYFFLKENPQLLVAYVKNIDQLNTFQDMMPNWNHTRIIWYKRIAPYIYCPVGLAHYKISFLIGLLVSLVMTYGVLIKSNALMDAQSNTINNLDYNKVVNWVRHVCKGESCIKNLSVFPNETWVRFSMNINSIYGCNRLKSGVFQCKNEQLFTVH
ncbi:MAG: hypothetical protein VW397_02975 [Candidatus Margulisiibacteriota bacterium]